MAYDNTNAFCEDGHGYLRGEEMDTDGYCLRCRDDEETDMTATIASEIITFEMHTMNSDDLDVKILTALRDALIDNDRWSEALEGDWEEFAKPTGCMYPDPESPDYLDDADARAVFIGTLETELGEVGLCAYADGESGMYVIEPGEDPREWGVLYSHAPELEVEVCESSKAAEIRGAEVQAAQPGIEWAVMVREPEGAWTEALSGLGPRALAALLWKR